MWRIAGYVFPWSQYIIITFQLKNNADVYAIFWDTPNSYGRLIIYVPSLYIYIYIPIKSHINPDCWWLNLVPQCMFFSNSCYQWSTLKKESHEISARYRFEYLCAEIMGFKSFFLMTLRICSLKAGRLPQPESFQHLPCGAHSISWFTPCNYG